MSCLPSPTGAVLAPRCGPGAAAPGVLCRLRGAVPAWLLMAAALVLCLLALAPASAQTRVANPFAGATWYVNPDYAAQLQPTIAQESDATLAQRMQTVGTYPTAVWMDRMAAIAGGDGRRSLAAHLDTALAQRQGNTPIVLKLVIYNLPGRDCAARASNGELSIAPNPPTQPLSGLETYKTQYIDPIVQVLSNPAYAGIRIVAVIEPDSLPNLVTNTNLAACQQALQSGAYVQGVQYAITRLHELPNVYQYLDIGHSGWLGWANNMTPAVTLYSQLVAGTPAGFGTIDGFVTNVANTLPTREPHMTSAATVGGQQVISARFYEYNPHIDEAGYAQALYQSFVTAGFPPTIGMLIDTSRNGWGGPARPAGPSTSTDVNTFVSATKIDRRAHRGLWCNPVGAGIGTPPQASPAGFFTQLQAFVWIKPPGESDGTYLASQSPRPDPNCDPAETNPLAGNTPTGAYPNSPRAGAFFATQFRDLVSNAHPPIPTSTTPSFAVAASPASVAVNRGASVTSNLTLTRSNGFSGAVSFSASGLPAGVTASFNPATTSSTGTSSVVTLSASATAALGAASITLTATGGGVTQTVLLALTVGAGGTPDFTLAASPVSVSVNAGGSATSTIAIARSGGFAGAVSFTASGLPPGVTASFNPASTSTTGTSTVLTLSAAAGAPAGTANVTVTGSGGGLSRTATLAVTVNTTGPTPDFTVSASPTALSVSAGASTASTLTLARSNGFSGAVSFSASGLPSGVTASFSPASTTGTSSVVTLAASSAAAPGTAALTLTASGGGLSRTATVTLTVTPGAGGGTATVTPVVAASSPYYNEQQVRLASTAPISALTVTIVLQRTTGLSYSGQYNTVGGAITQANSSSSTAITYTFALAPGQALAAGNYTFAAQSGGTGTAHPTTGDTFTVTYTSGGQNFSQTGRFQ